MTFTTHLLDSAIAAQKLPSDYALAKVLGVTRSGVSSYRTGRAFPSNSIACKLADLAGMPHVDAFFGVNLDRASTPESRALWRSLGAEIIATAAAQGRQ